MLAFACNRSRTAHQRWAGLRRARTHRVRLTAAVGGRDLSVSYVSGEWQWLVRRAGRDVAEGLARACLAAKQQAQA